MDVDQGRRKGQINTVDQFNGQPFNLPQPRIVYPDEMPVTLNNNNSNECSNMQCVPCGFGDCGYTNSLISNEDKEDGI